MIAERYLAKRFRQGKREGMAQGKREGMAQGSGAQIAVQPQPFS
jgi:flagellar biosynthesis/type III secretory pathway protein FliH